jgi:SAM-dependent methyltransferase
VTAEERLANDPTSELWGEHRSRYRFAAPLVAGKFVLDLGTGVGLGLQLLRQAGARPIGLDYDASALAEVRRLEPCARLVLGDATRLPFAMASLDAVVAFETIEHVPEPDAMVREIRRVLRPGGLLILSTPNRTFGPSERHTSNPFHIREFTPAELKSLLRESFVRVELFAQRPHRHYRFVPFLMVEPHYEPAAIAWKLLTRLPFQLKNGLALALGGRPFYPGEADYRFEPADAPTSHAILAVAS